jgi:molecular chaperone Hsp33
MPKVSLLAKTSEGAGAVLQEDKLLDVDASENWNRVNILLDTVEEMELIGPQVPPSDLLLRLFNEEQPRVYEAQPIEFGCTCSEERVRQSLSIYSARDIKTMTTDEGRVTADCQFCGMHYDLDPKSVGFEAEQKTGA